MSNHPHAMVIASNDPADAAEQMADIYKDRRNRWKEELLSGKYVQGHKHLKWQYPDPDPDDELEIERFCCIVNFLIARFDKFGKLC